MVKYFGGVEKMTVRAGVFRGEERVDVEREVVVWNGRRTGLPGRVVNGTKMGDLGVEIWKLVEGMGERGLKEVTWVQGGLKLVPLKDFVCDGKVEEVVRMEIIEWKKVKEIYY